MDFPDQIQLEILPLKGAEITASHFIILPHGEWMFAYISADSNALRVITKSTPTAEWTEENSQNLSNIQTTLQSKGNVKSFAMIVNNFGDLCLFMNIQEDQLLTIWYAKSTNYGKSWEPPKKISPFPEFESWKLAGIPILLNSGPSVGEYIVPLDHGMFQRALVLLSANNGAHRSPSLYIEPPELSTEEDPDPILYGSISPKICELPAGMLKLFCQVTDTHEIYTYVSRDYGGTWEDPRPCAIEEIAPNSTFDVLGIHSPQDHDRMWIYLLGSQKIENEFLPTLWRSSDEGETFTVVWHADQKSKQPSTHSQLYQNTSKIHALCMVFSSYCQEQNREKKATEVLQLYTLQIV
jgi:hypothetical protein